MLKKVSSSYALLSFTLAAAGVAMAVPTPANAQGSTQVVLIASAKHEVGLTPGNVSLEVNGKATPLASLAPLPPDQTQVALLIDDGIRSSLGRQFTDIQDFIKGLKPGVEVMIGYMQNGRVVTAQAFTTNHAAAAEQLRLPFSSPGLSASPYICISDFAKNWPRESMEYGAQAAEPRRMFRFVLALTNGVDPYNGSVSPLNQDSPYVDTASTDAQRAGVLVSSIYYPDAGIRGGAASFSGQSYLSQIAEATGGTTFNQFRGAPPSLAPYFKGFAATLDQAYVASFNAPDSKGNTLASLRFKTKASGVKIRSAKQVRVAEAL